MNFCNLFALPNIPFRGMHRALLSVLVCVSLLSGTELRSQSQLKMGEQARGQSYDLKEQYEEVISPSSDMNKWISTTAFPININSFMVS